MGSKKHKKESKKKKHTSRSLSPIDVEEYERKRHRKHKDRKKDRSPDVEEVPVDSHLYKADHNESTQSSRSSSIERDRLVRETQRSHASTQSQSHSSRNVEPEESTSAAGSGAVHDSLSIEETNRLRAKLGLKPLEVTEKLTDDGKIKDDLGEFYHKPADNIAHKKKTEKIKQKLEERREKRKLEQKLQSTATLGEGSTNEEDAAAWVKKSRQIQQQRAQAAMRAAMLDEMDAVFGVSALVAEEEEGQRAASYTARELRGLRVAHDLDALGDERETILTLADKDVLAEDTEDVLVNVNIVDDEKYKKNILERKKAKAGYQAYDDEADLEAAALGYNKPVLSKYDEEIDKGKADKSRGFLIGDDDAILQAKKFREMMRQERLQGGGDKRLESLQLPALQLATDYMDERDIHTKFKKIKKKGKIRKKPKAEPVDNNDASTTLLDTDDTDVKPELLTQQLAVDEEEVEVDSELQIALARARRLRQEGEALQKMPKVEEILECVKEEAVEDMETADSSNGGAIVVDATAEFCRTLGDIPTYGLAGNRDHKAEIIDFERDMELDMESEDHNAGAWSRVDVDNEKPPDLAAGSSVVLDAEPSLGRGVAGALQLALSKGYLERAGTAPAPRPISQHLLAARHYSIEDKTYGEDDKYGRRERGGGGHHGGPLQEFREKSGFRPSIKLEYVDDDGRPLCPKEAFRYLSHKFHGKGPGKNKQEKRIKKAVQEGLMKKMSSTDTPLNTLQMLQEKQRETRSPYILLSGAKREHNE